eukprot:Nk52_evm28s554 gene=Nk52_evmTU28s554
MDGWEEFGNRLANGESVGEILAEIDKKTNNSNLRNPEEPLNASKSALLSGNFGASSFTPKRKAESQADDVNDGMCDNDTGNPFVTINEEGKCEKLYFEFPPVAPPPVDSESTLNLYMFPEPEIDIESYMPILNFCKIP